MTARNWPYAGLIAFALVVSACDSNESASSRQESAPATSDPGGEPADQTTDPAQVQRLRPCGRSERGTVAPDDPVADPLANPGVNPGDRLRATATLQSIDGQYDEQVLRRYMRRKLIRWRDCYVKRLATRGDLRGTMTATFQIDAQGHITDIKTGELDPELSACVAPTLATVQVPRPTQGAVRVRYEFEFAPTGGRTRTVVSEPCID